MNLIWQTPPASVLKVARSVTNFVPRHDRRWAGTASSVRGEGWVERVFWADIQSVLDKPIPEAARSAGWRFLSADAGRELSAVYVNDQDPANPKLTSVSHGVRLRPYFDSVRQIDQIAEEHPAPDQCFVRVLTIPCLLIETFWMSPESANSGATDWVVPFRSMVPGLAEMEVVTADEFLAVCRPVAQRQVELHPLDKYGPPKM